jgi:serine/threonine protein kinase
MARDASAVLISDQEAGDQLPPGTVLLHGQYTLTGLINSGGFGITYLAKDRLNRELVIKECFVSAYCRRTQARVRAGSQAHKAELDMIIGHFITEAQRMARLTHPNIVGVRQVFEENDTAYIAVDYVKGKDLLESLASRSDPAWLVEATIKILSALEYVHGRSLLHCDIAPDNILIDESGEPKLIDFGAARLLEVGVGARNSGPLVIKDGYSPHELYFNAGNSGPWTDIYSLGATLAHCITGNIPVPGPERLAAIVEKRADPYVKVTGSFPYPSGFLRSIDRAMSIMPRDRYQSATEWISDLNGAMEPDETNVKLFRRPAPKVTPAAGEANAPKQETPADNNPIPDSTPKSKGNEMTINLTALSEINGFIGACLVDSETGLMMASEGGQGFDLEAASAANTEVVKAKLNAIQMLKLNDHIDDILISLGKQLHLIRPLEKTPSVFIYVALDRKAANLGMARVQVKNVEQSIAM